ncbi:hypothetical protein Hamer_G015414 [Homarus americanus]|uniref:Uncharacterized protein n=1 Tax=Homarus americanus TaxID=6706 RepID=A0A8J5NCB3_HOMAM|nr:hypothetical protein Hamer_G015414 [Homarus americanus]
MKKLSPEFYHNVFTRDYNIVFRVPLTDVCNTCEKLETQTSSLQKDGQDTSDVRNTLREHKAIAQVPRDLLHQAEQGGPGNGDVKTVVIDLQQTLPRPRLRANNAYYKQKLWVYNFCVYNMDKREANVEGNIIKIRLMKGRGHWVKKKLDLSQVVLSPKYIHNRLLAPEKVNDLMSLLSLLEGRAQEWLQDLIARQDDLRGAGEVQQREELVDDPDDTATWPWVLRECSHTPPTCNVDDLDC